MTWITRWKRVGFLWLNWACHWRLDLATELLHCLLWDTHINLTRLAAIGSWKTQNSQSLKLNVFTLSPHEAWVCSFQKCSHLRHEFADVLAPNIHQFISNRQTYLALTIAWHESNHGPDSKFMGPIWGPPGSCRPQMGPMLAPCTLLSGVTYTSRCGHQTHYGEGANCWWFWQVSLLQR